jgi:hypothetical protein
MTDRLFEDLRALFESNEKRFDGPIKAIYEETVLTELDQVPKPEPKVEPEDTDTDGELPMASHPSVFPQPSVSDGIMFINPKAIPNDYSKGHVVCVLKVDKADKKVRVDQLKNGAVHLPFSIIKKDESGREYVTKEDVLGAFNRGAYVWKLLKLQPLSLDRNIKPDKFGRAGDDANRVQATNPNVETPDGEMKGDATAQDNLRRAVAHRAAGTRGDGESPQEFQHAYGKDLATGKTDAERARNSGLPKPPPLGNRKKNW